MDSANSDRPLISIVTPCFNEEENVLHCYQSVRGVFESALGDFDYEHIFCDNDSTDETVRILRKLAQEDSRVKVIVNARNFGPIHSNFNGVMATTGDAVVVCLPADLQDPPELIPEFVRRWREGYRVVWGIRTQREEGWLMRTVRGIYYRTVRKLASVDVPVGGGLFQLVDRRVIDAIADCEDYYPFVPGLVAHSGFRSTRVEYTWKRRERSVSKATLLDMSGQAINGFISFSRVPLRVSLVLGLLISVSTILLGGGAWLARFILFGIPLVTTSTMLALLLLFVSGIQLFFLGIVGEYLGAVHQQVRKRPLVVEAERINFDVDRQLRLARDTERAAS